MIVTDLLLERLYLALVVFRTILRIVHFVFFFTTTTRMILQDKERKLGLNMHTQKDVKYKMRARALSLFQLSSPRMSDHVCVCTYTTR